MKTARLGDVTTKIGSGATPRGGEAVYARQGVALIRSQNVLDSAMKRDGLAYLDEAAANQLSGVTVEQGDVLLNITGESVARCAQVDPMFLPARVNQHVMILRPGADLEPGFLQSFLVSPAVKSELLGMSSGGTRRALTKRQIADLRIPMPPRQEQRAIAEVLGALDDKIAANDRVARLAYEVAQALFLSMSAGAAQSAMKDMVSTEYGLTTSPLGRGTHKLLRVTDINKSPWTDYSKAPSVTPRPDELAKYSVREGDILVARMADPGKSTHVDAGSPPAVFASYLVRLRPTADVPPLWVFHYLRSPQYRDYCNNSMSGSVQANMNAKVIVGGEMPIAQEGAMTSFAERARQLHGVMAAAVRESARLAAVRDALLPELMSGRLRVKDAVRDVEEVL